MEYTQFGQTSLRVSKISYGTWQFGGDWGSFDVREAQAAIRQALELGITFFDTAQAYGFGVSERVLGEALKPELKSQRDTIILATKGGLRMEGDTLLRDASAGWLRQGVEQMRAFEQTRKLDALQPPYSLFRRDIEQAILPYTQQQGIGVLVYGPLAHGLLGGSFTLQTTFAQDDWRSKNPFFKGDSFQRNLAAVERLKQLAAREGMTVAQLAIAWVLAQPAIDVAIVGAHKPGQLEQSARAGEMHLPQETLQEIERIMREAVSIGGPSPEGM